jgi:hypothetical protein
MNIIYARAKEVIVWLGDDHYSDMFVKYCNSFSRLRQGKPANRSLVETCIRELATEKLLRSPLESQTAVTIANSFINFVSRPWFKHIWVYQEILLAPSCPDSLPRALVTSGRHVLPWRDFIEAVRGIEDAQDMLTPAWAWAGMEKDQEKLRYTTEWFSSAWIRPSLRRPNSLVSTFRETSTFLASDPRDKIYALLHICLFRGDTMSGSPLFVPDYEKSIQEIILNFFT